MKIKQMVEFLGKYEENREVVLHHWDGRDSRFIPLSPACTPTANTRNLLVLIRNDCFERPIK